jgi:hypothetical protein
METIKEKVEKMTQLILGGKAMDAFETFYHADVVMQENESTPTIGKEANRNRELEFFANITDFRKAQVQGVAIGENLSTVIWQFD